MLLLVTIRSIYSIQETYHKIELYINCYSLLNDFLIPQDLRLIFPSNDIQFKNMITTKKGNVLISLKIHLYMYNKGSFTPT